MIVQDHTTEEYLKAKEALLSGKHNGAFYYSKEIVESFIPKIKTSYNWQTINHQIAPEHCIVFVHSNNALDRYDYLLNYKDVILVCSTNHSLEQLKNKGHRKVIYVPLSIDTKYLDNFKSKEKNGVVACGNVWAFSGSMKRFFKENNIKHYHDIEREEMLKLMGSSEKVYAIGRTAMEAIYLGATVEQPDKEYPVEKYSTYYTQDEAIDIMQKELDRIEDLKSWFKNKNIVVGIATTKDRTELLETTLASLENQTVQPDRIFVYENEGDGLGLTDNAKFYFTDKAKEYYLTCDDGMIYPPDYIAKMVCEIEKNGGKPTTYHGRKLKGFGLNYYQGHESFGCMRGQQNNEFVNVCGTGVLGFNINYIKSIGFDFDSILNDERKLMSDLLFSLEWAKRSKGEPMKCVKHSGGWIKEMHYENSIFVNNARDQFKTPVQNLLADEILKIVIDSNSDMSLT